MSNKKVFITSFILFLSLILAVDYFVLHILFPLKKAQIQKEINDRIEHDIKTNEPTLPPNVSAEDVK